MTNASPSYKLLKSLLLIGHQQICHIYLSCVIENELREMEALVIFLVVVFILFLIMTCPHFLCIVEFVYFEIWTYRILPTRMWMKCAQRSPYVSRIDRERAHSSLKFKCPRQGRSRCYRVATDAMNNMTHKSRSLGKPQRGSQPRLSMKIKYMIHIHSYKTMVTFKPRNQNAGNQFWIRRRQKGCVGPIYT